MKVLREILSEEKIDNECMYPALQDKINRYKDYLKLSYLYENVNDDIFKDINKEIKAKKILELREKLKDKINKIEQIFYYVKILEKIEYPLFKKSLQELNKAELEKFLINTKTNLVYKELKTKELKNKLKRDFKFVLQNDKYLLDLKNLIALL